MRKSGIHLLAYFFFCAGVSAQQYPFVQYSPKDGLISSRVRNIYQDSRGRLFFSTLNGLSIYDGARFMNFNSENGLSTDVVNCVMEMGDDSIWVVTNAQDGIECFRDGKMKPVSTGNTHSPTINYLCRSGNGTLYAAADDGMFVFENNAFVKLPFSASQENDINSFISYLVPVGDFLLVMRDYGLLTTSPLILYLYNCRAKKMVSQTPDGLNVFSVAASRDGRIWITTQFGVRQLNTAALRNGEIVVEDIPQIYNDFDEPFGHIFFDNEGNCWNAIGPRLKKCDRNGNTTTYSVSSGLNSIVDRVFQDREGIIWLASIGGSVQKLMHTNLSLMERPFGLVEPINLASSGPEGDLFLNAPREKKIVRFGANQQAQTIRVEGAVEFNFLATTEKDLYLIDNRKIFRLEMKNGVARPRLILYDTSGNRFGTTTIDKHGALIVSGLTHLTAVTGNTIFQIPIQYMSDQITVDRDGKIWTATRSDYLIQVSVHPENPKAYLQLEFNLHNELKGMSPRSIAIDKNDRIWIGTRHRGILVFEFHDKQLKLVEQITSKSGLTENFISHLNCDAENNIWASSPSGLDKIGRKDGRRVIENVTRQNNMYIHVYHTAIDKSNTVWAFTSGGLIKVTPAGQKTESYIPKLMISQIRIGADTLNENLADTLKYKQNNISFYFSAPSFMDERQIGYSYRLNGAANTEWTEPSNNASATFVGLRPGHYTLTIKANFPAGRYPDQLLRYKFYIAPPWWKTWWFRVLVGVLLTVAIFYAIRLYYLRKLERHKAVLEQQQAVEKERTRIATDMHDDLGAGLSRIKFLSETMGIKQQRHQSIDEEISKIREYSHEMIDKMGEIVWALNEKNDSLSDLLSYTRAYAVEYLSMNGIVCTVDTPDNFPATFVSGEYRRNIYLTVKEALHNIFKHSQATAVHIIIRADERLQILIQDNGIGFDRKNIQPFRNGLSNMESRMKEIHGWLEVVSEKGTLVKISAPMPK